MRKIIIIIIATLAILSIVFAAEEQDFTQAINLVNANTSCDDLTFNQLELIGDYYMEQLHSGDVNQIMVEMMGGEGSESLRQVHINMAYRYYCSQFGNSEYPYNGMMGTGGMMSNNNYNTNYRGAGMMDDYLGFSFFATSILILVILFVLSLIVWFIYLLAKAPNKDRRKKSREPLEIAKERFARGEITKEELNEIRKELK